MERIRVRVRLFGAFRQYSKGPEVSFEAPWGATVSGLRSLLVEELKRENPGFDSAALIADSVLADDMRVLAEDQALNPASGEANLAILPPVCGG